MIALDKLTEKVYKKVFGEEISPTAKKFIKNLSYLAIAIIFSKFLVMAFQLYAGNVLGPLDYGKYTLVITLSFFFCIPMAIVGTATTKYLAEKKKLKEKQKIISTGLFITLILMTIWIIIYSFILDPLSKFLSISKTYVFLAIIVAIVYTLWTINLKIYQGLERFKKISLFHILRTIVMLSSIIILFYFAGKFPRYAVLAYSLGYLIPALIFLPKLKRYIKPMINKETAKILLKYGVILLFAATSSSILKNIDKLFINSLLDTATTGLYQAYIVSTIGIAETLGAIFITIFFPFSSKGNKQRIWDKSVKLIKFIPLITIAIFTASIPIYLLYGKKYPFNPLYLLIFAVAGTTLMVYQIYAWYIASFGIKGVKISATAIIMASILNIFLNYNLIPILGILGAILSTFISYSLGITYIVASIKIRKIKNLI